MRWLAPLAAIEGVIGTMSRDGASRRLPLHSIDNGALANDRAGPYPLGSPQSAKETS